MARTVTIEGDLAELLERFRAARDARRVASKALEQNDNHETFTAYNAAQRAEEVAAVLVALSVSNRAEAA